MGHPLAWTALLDIGSTYTKGIAVRLDDGQPIVSTQVPSSIAIDVSMGVDRVIEQLTAAAGCEPQESFASSSAQGGLAVVAIGLVPRYTLEAALQAALGAGAKVLNAFGYRLTAADVEDITASRPDVILLCGGTDGGDEESMLSNARRLCEGAPRGTVLVAGNRVATPVAAQMLAAAGWAVEVLPNLLPELNRLNVQPVRDCLRELFLGRITHAKGIDKATEMLDGVVMPTPAAVLAAGELLGGLGELPALLGDLMIVDLGGATTDIVSVVTSDPDENLVRIGLPEPAVKRTVEGDLGLRHNAGTIVDRYGIAGIAERSGLSAEVIREVIGLYEGEPGRLPESNAERSLDRELAAIAIHEATLRHAGVVDEIRVPHQASVFRVTGRDLRKVSTVIGTGGILICRSDTASLLERTAFETARPESLRPMSPVFLVDRHYALYACGLLADRHPEQAGRLAEATLSLTRV